MERLETEDGQLFIKVATSTSLVTNVLLRYHYHFLQVSFPLVYAVNFS